MEKNTTPIDWNELLKLTNNNSKIAKDLISMFGKELPGLRKTINNAYDNKNDALLQSNVHKLHGSCCYTGAVTLKKITNTLEGKLKNKDNDGVDILMEQLNTEIDRVITFINKGNFEKP